MSTLQSAQPMTLQVARFRAEALGVVSIELIDPHGGELPGWEPGAHVELRLPNGLSRLYSLCGDSSDRYSYRLGIGLAASSSGGSAWLHAHLREGDLLKVMPPRNLFPLDTEAERYCFIAGGIGITPLLAMLQWCQRHGKPWRLLYCVRSRLRAAFAGELAALPQVQLFCDDEAGGRLDVAAFMASLQPGEQLWCCGPQGLMQAVERHGSHLPAEYLHFESFDAAPGLADVAEHPFEVVLRRSNQRLQVPVGRSILDVLLEAGVKINYACRSGVCGACMTKVLGGAIEHRDMLLSDEQRKAGDRMLVCVSRAVSGELELDL